MTQYFAISPEEAVRLLSVKCGGVEYVPVSADAVGRVMAETIYLDRDFPEGNVSVLDGYLVEASSPAGARLRVAGECGPGERVERVPRGYAVKVFTGCIIDNTSYGVVPLEDVAELEEGEIVLKASPGKSLSSVVTKGSSGRKGDPILRKGKVLTPVDLELLRILGLDYVAVCRKPLIGVLSVGEEISLGRESGKNVTTRFLFVEAAIRRLGAEPINLGVVRDDRSLIAKTVGSAIKNLDALIIIGGTGPSARDVTVRALEELSPDRMFVGLSVRNAKRVSGAIIGEKPVLVLPGPRNPAINGFVLIGAHVIGFMSGKERIEYRVPAVLEREVRIGEGLELVWLFLVASARGRLSAKIVDVDYLGFKLGAANAYILASGDVKGEVSAVVPVYLI